ncbi:MAG: hypothetical protein WC101_00980 [Candidatus Gracilibacteria bacterium]
MAHKTEYSLSRYFPEGTEYFYGYPAEEDSHFFNGVAPEIEEMVSGRPMVCAGPNVKTICFSACLDSVPFSILRDDLDVIRVDRKQILTLPKDVSVKVRGAKRNKLIKNALFEMVGPKQLVMAQPYLDPRAKTYYAIPPHRSIWLNDKRNMVSYIPKAYLPEIYEEFMDGACFKQADQLPLPCVVKVTSSSSGDGVRICYTHEDVERAKADFGHLEGMIFVSEYVKIYRNFAVQFGISHNPEQPIEIINWHEQMVSPFGGFLGGIIEPHENEELFQPLNKVLLEKILPEVRRRGWYGVGGFDVLMTEDGRFYFIDPNFRMTGMTVYDFLARNNVIKKSLLSFNSEFHGSEREFREKILPVAKPGANQLLYVTVLTHGKKVFRLNSALLFDKRSDIPKVTEKLLSLGLVSSVLDDAMKMA